MKVNAIGAPFSSKYLTIERKNTATIGFTTTKRTMLAYATLFLLAGAAQSTPHAKDDTFKLNSEGERNIYPETIQENNSDDDNNNNGNNNNNNNQISHGMGANSGLLNMERQILPTVGPIDMITRPTVGPIDMLTFDIIRCRQTLQCHNAGGSCSALYQKGCDYYEHELCVGSFCYCCINCVQNADASDCHRSGGTCTKMTEGKCTCPNDDAYVSLHQCPTSGCSCCRPCDTPRGCTKCVKNPRLYIRKGYYVDKDVRCPQKGCVCVQDPCKDTGVCQKVGGKCMSLTTKEDCPRHYVILECECGDKCFCCVSRCGATPNQDSRLSIP